MSKHKATVAEADQAPAQPIAGLTEGRIVHYILDNGKHRPAIIVQVWDNITGMSNLQVFRDGNNDGYSPDQAATWAGSVFYADAADQAPGTWHFIEPV
jgi:hypothetical protein